MVGNTVNTVKNSLEFADFIRGKTLDAEDELVSFDVVSLFTKIPVDLAIEVAKKRLREGVSLLACGLSYRSLVFLSEHNIFCL